MESRNQIIRDIFVRLCSEHVDVIRKVLAYNAVRISNDLYGNEVASAHELEKGYTRMIQDDLPFSLPDSIQESHEDLVAVLKLNKILRSKAISESAPDIEDLLQVYCNHYG